MQTKFLIKSYLWDGVPYAALYYDGKRIGNIDGNGAALDEIVARLQAVHSNMGELNPVRQNHTKP
jgi:hypothetical protein